MKIGVFDSRWDYNVTSPYSKPLGGTQSAICYFIEEMHKRGHNVYLFNDIKSITEVNSIPHIPYKLCLEYIKKSNIVFDLVIVSCLANDLVELKEQLNNTNTLYCLWTGHDSDQPASIILKEDKLKDYIDLFIFVSKWQCERYVEKYNISYSKVIIMRNGIGKPFEKYLNLPSNKKINSMTYCSIPWRGLVLLSPIYKSIKNVKPDSSLKIFSGLNIYNMKEENNIAYDELKQMDDVEYNYGVDQEKLAEELYKIDFLTYPNIFPETSCITVLQAMACGCIVITSDLGALKETMGGLNEYVDINIKNFDTHNYIEKYVNKLYQYIILPENIKEVLRENNREHIRKNYLWSIICEKFEQDINKFREKYSKYMEEYKTILHDGTTDFFKNDFISTLNKYNKLYFYPIIMEYYLIKLNSGVSHFNLNNLELAKHNFKIAKSIKDDFNINKNLAALHIQKGNVKKFLQYGREALNIDFNCFLANLMAQKCEEEGYYHEAISLYNSILKLEPDNINCLNNLGNLYLLMIAQLDNIELEMESKYNESLNLAIKNNETRKKELIVSNIIFNKLYNWNLSEEDIYNKAIEWGKYIVKEEKLLEISSKLNRKILCNDKIRIGYISTDFVTHPVGFMFESILKNHDINRYEIFCYDNSGKVNDTTSIKLRKYNKATWYDISSKSDVEVLDIMINDNLDIMVDMMGHTRNNRMNLLQYKPARIQISYFAYPSTSGIKEIDYKFTDKYANPPETQKYFTEKLYYLPNGFQCYTPPEELDGTKNYTRNTSGTSSGKYKIILGCFNNPIKLSIPTIDTFVMVLKELPEAKLVLRYCYYKSSYYRESIIKLFTSRGIERERIDIGHETLIISLNMYRNIDIVLDPFPYNGGTISSEALYMNSPIITMAGTNYVSRVGVSLLSNMGLEKYIATTPEEYVTKVVELARNEKELKELHQTLRIRMKNCDLANSISFTKHIEEAYEDMIKKYCEP